MALVDIGKGTYDELSSSDPDSYSQQITEHVGSLIPGPARSPCSTAYLITREGARALLAHVLDRGFQAPTDGLMELFLTTHDRNYVARRLLAKVDPAFGSDMQHVVARADLP